MRELLAMGWKHAPTVQKALLAVLLVCVAADFTIFGFTLDWMMLFTGINCLVVCAFLILVSAQQHMIRVYAPLAVSGYVLGRAMESAQRRGVDTLTIRRTGEHQFTIQENP